MLAVEQDRFAPGQDAAADRPVERVRGADELARRAGDGALAPIAGGRYRVVLRPAVGDNERRKLVGCLEDLTVDRVLGDVESFRMVAAG